MPSLGAILALRAIAALPAEAPLERDDIPPDRSDAAAKAAGFPGDGAIGPYLRTLIQSHHDTLATPVR